ncbi:MAG: quinolinate synthase NadA [Thermogemmatispora sp.]|uniref:quinolinate synthase NadA n=1 Tax=Thermogemmatispora sp. TaxID=1968838 RepID=UPI001A0A30FF|nr:quinolinate synthase NadA [Thermogemmatispora sp.]MBE3565000.1 quinolinate synthase NadA [Thermogemmatispora sp.]
MALQTACEASQESRILPLLHPATRDHYAHGGRADHIPRRYAEMDGAELERRISQAKAALGRRLLILGHHYQRDEIIKYADLRGDSFKLAQQAAARPEADYIVFCGVHFMAESADILSAPHQQVILPNPTAGCSMADMASIAEVEECWETLNEVLGEEAGLVPVTYINSAASLKAFCGEHGGIVCTSSNAFKVMEWAFSHGRRLLFFPDEHLGRNTGHAYGIPEEEMVVWNPKNPQETLDDEERLQRARLILWKGYCSTHMRFTVQQIAKARADYPGITVIVHPECRREVVEAADLYGSTEYIIQQIEQAPAGTKWAVGTEINLVHRLAQAHPDKLIFCLDPIVCPCSTMYRIHPAYLAWVLEALVDGQVINQVKVAPEVAHWARVALDRMLALK